MYFDHIPPTLSRPNPTSITSNVMISLTLSLKLSSLVCVAQRLLGVGTTLEYG